MESGEEPIRRPYTLLCLRAGGAVEAVEMMGSVTLDPVLERADALLAQYAQYVCVEIWQDDVRLAIRLRAG